MKLKTQILLKIPHRFFLQKMNNLPRSISLIIVFSLAVSVFAHSESFGTTRPLFKRGSETFKIVDPRGQSPTIRVLTGSITKKTLAMALNSYFELAGSKSTKINPYVDLHLETITLRPLKKDSNKLAIEVRVSGQSVELEPIVNKAELVNGHLVHVTIPRAENDLSFFEISSKASFTLLYEKREDQLLISDAVANFQIKMPMNKAESEQIKFSGKGLRQ